LQEKKEYKVSNLLGNNIHGHFPFQFGNFSSLNVLNVASNNFEAQTFATLGKFNKLKVEIHNLFSNYRNKTNAYEISIQLIP
jgi:hypothetical protein